QLLSDSMHRNAIEWGRDRGDDAHQLVVLCSPDQMKGVCAVLARAPGHHRFWSPALAHSVSRPSATGRSAPWGAVRFTLTPDRMQMNLGMHYRLRALSWRADVRCLPNTGGACGSAAPSLRGSEAPKLTPCPLRITAWPPPTIGENGESSTFSS